MEDVIIIVTRGSVLVTRPQATFNQVQTLRFTSHFLSIIIIEGPGAYPAYVEFWAIFYFCSDLPKFWHVSYKLI